MWTVDTYCNNATDKSGVGNNIKKTKIIRIIQEKRWKKIINSDFKEKGSLNLRNKNGRYSQYNIHI